jgi:hypothetical protein
MSKEIREIRFRVFHEGKMYYLKKGSALMLCFFSEGIPWGLYNSSTDQRLVSGDPDAILSTPGILSLFTGFRLKGKDLYQGDILEFDLADGQKEIGVIRMSKEGFWTSQLEGYQEELLSRELACKSIPIKLIGNIYQNPELCLALDSDSKQ